MRTAFSPASRCTTPVLTAPPAQQTLASTPAALAGLSGVFLVSLFRRLMKWGERLTFAQHAFEVEAG